MLMLEFDIRQSDSGRRLEEEGAANVAGRRGGGLFAARMPAGPAFNVGVLLVPGFPLLSLAAIVEPMRGANRHFGRDLYQWTLLSPQRGDVASNSGVAVQTSPLSEMRCDGLDMMVVCSGIQGERYHDPAVVGLLRRLHRHQVAIAAVNTGSFILAQAGLLRNRRCTVHWEYADSFQEKFPEQDLCEDLFVFDGDVVTCAGETAALDFMLQMIRSHHGGEMTRAIAAGFLHTTVRAPSHDQREMRHRAGTTNTVVLLAIELMEKTIEEPVPPRSIGEKIGVSQRQLERLFNRHLGCTPARYNMRLRLDRARRMLRQTDLSVAEVAVACGFVALSHFAKVYHRTFGCRPSRDRVA
jgi:transcriptional regulator GlxA family with amidase domain